MRNSTYWTYDERHPKPNGPGTLAARVHRFFDRLDDFVTSGLSRYEYHRLKRLAAA